MISVETLDNDIVQISESVFNSMLGMQLARAQENTAHPPEGMMLTGVVQITGNWSGAVTVECSEKFARKIASTMFGTDEAAASESEINDSLGEMANMVGGNFKSLLDPPTQLSLPSVTRGVGYKLFIPGAKLLSRVGLVSDGEGIIVTVLTRAR